jgi:hypothetical protein
MGDAATIFLGDTSGAEPTGPEEEARVDIDNNPELLFEESVLNPVPVPGAKDSWSMLEVVAHSAHVTLRSFSTVIKMTDVLDLHLSLIACEVVWLLYALV